MRIAKPRRMSLAVPTTVEVYCDANRKSEADEPGSTDYNGGRWRCESLKRSCMQSSLCLGKRPYSILSDEIALSRLPNIDQSKLQITRTKSPKDLIPSEQLIFGRLWQMKIAKGRREFHFPVCQILIRPSFK